MKSYMFRPHEYEGVVCVYKFILTYVHLLVPIYIYIYIYIHTYIPGVDKSLARPGRKQATKLEIYST